MKLVALVALLVLTPTAASAATISVARPAIVTDLANITAPTRVESAVTVAAGAEEVVTYTLTREAFRHPLVIKASGVLAAGTTAVWARCQTSSLPYNWRITVFVNGTATATNVAGLRCA
jgi:hypothetical protein